jgi:hypothetical protein
MIVIDKKNRVLGSAPLIERVDAQGEKNLIKVNVNPNSDYGYFYIGTIDRDDYQIIDDVYSPDDEKLWKYIDGEFIEYFNEEE